MDNFISKQDYRTSVRYPIRKSDLDRINTYQLSLIDLWLYSSHTSHQKDLFLIEIKSMEVFLKYNYKNFA